MKRLLHILLALAFAAIALPASAQPSFPELAGQPVVDAADIIDPATEEALNRQLLEFEQRNQRQFAIATIPTLDGYDISDYGYQLGREWGLGDAEENDGIILIVAPNERRMRIEVGYGLEGIMPDGLAFEIVEDMKPFFRDGDYSGGIQFGADQIITQLELPPEQAAQVAQQASEARQSDGGIPVGGLIWLGFLLFFFVIPMLFGRGRRRRYRGGGGLSGGGIVGDIILWEAGKAIARGAMGDDDHWGGGGGFGGGFGGGGGGGFGGFSGGGGSFGGGGASGGW